MTSFPRPSRTALGDGRADKVTLRPATAADMEALLAEPLPFRVRAFAAEKDGVLLGVGGFAYLPGGTVGAFVIMVEGARRHRLALHKAGLAALAEARRLKIPRLVAMAEPGVEPAPRWLRRLGFRETDVDGEQVFVWEA